MFGSASLLSNLVFMGYTLSVFSIVAGMERSSFNFVMFCLIILLWPQKKKNYKFIIPVLTFFLSHKKFKTTLSVPRKCFNSCFVFSLG